MAQELLNIGGRESAFEYVHSKSATVPSHQAASLVAVFHEDNVMALYPLSSARHPALLMELNFVFEKVYMYCISQDFPRKLTSIALGPGLRSRSLRPVTGTATCKGSTGQSWGTPGDRQRPPLRPLPPHPVRHGAPLTPHHPLLRPTQLG